PPLLPLTTPGSHAAPAAPGGAPGPAIVRHPPGAVANPAAHPPAIVGDHGPSRSTGHPPAIAAPGHPPVVTAPRGPAEPHPRAMPQANLRPTPLHEAIRPPEPARPPQHLAAPARPPEMRHPAPTPASHPPPAAAVHPPRRRRPR